MEPRSSKERAVGCRAALDAFVTEIRAGLGDRLASLVLYGSAVDSLDHRGAVDVMLLVERVDLDLLDRVAAPTRSAVVECGLSLLVLTPDDLRSSTDVFPIQFAAMQQHYRVLAGSDPLASLVIGRDHLRLRLEQELKNLLLRLRRQYLVRGGRPDGLESVLVRAAPDLVSHLRVLIELSDADVDSPTTTEDPELRVLEAAHPLLEVDVGPVRQILALCRREAESEPSGVRDLYGRFLAVVERAAELADGLTTG